MTHKCYNIYHLLFYRKVCRPLYEIVEATERLLLCSPKCSDGRYKVLRDKFNKMKFRPR